ncbi:MAG: SCP2 sterol-binding domain-containing protein [Candidatus Thermoplasmatota archaeon]
MDDIEHLLHEAVEKFNAKVHQDARLQEELEGIERTVVLRLSNGAAYNLRIEGGRLSGLSKGDVAEAEVVVESDAATIAALLRKEMGPMKAFALRKVRVKADLEDIVRLRRFF